ncbi:MAG: hypothetical protein V1822_00240 [Candidatus Micrarchaeota archaeon]
MAIGVVKVRQDNNIQPKADGPNKKIARGGKNGAHTGAFANIELLAEQPAAKKRAGRRRGMSDEKIFEGFREAYGSLENITATPVMLAKRNVVALAKVEIEKRKMLAGVEGKENEYKHWLNSVKHRYLRDPQMTSRWYGEDGILVCLLYGSGWFGEGEVGKKAAFGFSKIVQRADEKNHTKKARNITKERWKNQEFAQKISDAIINKWKDPEFREEMETKFSSEETREKKSRIMKEKWTQKRYRKHVSDGVRAAKNGKADGQIAEKQAEKTFDVAKNGNGAKNHRRDKLMLSMDSSKISGATEIADTISYGRVKIDSKGAEWLLTGGNNGSKNYAKLPKLGGIYSALSCKSFGKIKLLDEAGLKERDEKLLEEIKALYGSLEALKKELQKGLIGLTLERYSQIPAK